MGAFHLQCAAKADEIAGRAHMLGGHDTRLALAGQKGNSHACGRGIEKGACETCRTYRSPALHNRLTFTGSRPVFGERRKRWSR